MSKNQHLTATYQALISRSNKQSTLAVIDQVTKQRPIKLRGLGRMNRPELMA